MCVRVGAGQRPMDRDGLLGRRHGILGMSGPRTYAGQVVQGGREFRLAGCVGLSQLPESRDSFLGRLGSVCSCPST
jgi:hypothetical protein